jgi:hypothetical protein
LLLLLVVLWCIFIMCSISLSDAPLSTGSNFAKSIRNIIV